MTHPLFLQVDPFLLSLKQERRLQTSTIELYRIEIGELLRLLHSPEEIHGIKSYLGHKASGTHHRKLIMWKAFLFTCDPPWRNCLDSMQYPKVSTKIPKFFSNEDKEKLLKACKTTREKILISLGLHLGLRRNELLELKFNSIEANFLRVYRKGAKEQRLPLSESLSELLKGLQMEIDANPSDSILQGPNGKKLTAGGLAFLFKQIASRAGVDGSLHAMRHTFATCLMSRGADLLALKELMGHSSLKTTERYLHVTPSHLMKTLELLN